MEPHIWRHAIAFYNKLIPVFQEASAQFFLMRCEKCNTIVGSLQSINDGEPLATLWHNYPNIVMRPKLTGDNDTADIKNLKQVTYLERVFADLLTAHGDDHMKGGTLYFSLGEIVHNVPHDVCKIFTDLCAHCIQHHNCSCPTAGLCPIVINGFNVCSQVDLINFQSMLDSKFQFLLNYIDHGVKYLFSIPIVRKRASCIATYDTAVQ